MPLRYPPTDYLELMGLETRPDPDGLYEIRDGGIRIEYPPCIMGGRVWEGLAEADNASKRLAVGMYALQNAEEWREGTGAARAFQTTRELYASRAGLLDASGKLTVATILLELHGLIRIMDAADATARSGNLPSKMSVIEMNNGLDERTVL